MSDKGKKGENPPPIVNRAVREKRIATSGEIIELKPAKKNQKREPNRAVLFALAILAVIAAMYFFFEEDIRSASSTEASIALLYPSKKLSPISETEAKQKLAQATQLFYSDSFSGYYKAQNILVELLESGFANVDAMSLLCLTHRELWPYANQDSKDLMALSRMAQLASRKDPVGLSGATCRVVQNLLGGQFDGAASLTDSILNERPDAAAFYEFKSSILVSRGDILSAAAYLEKTIQLIPKWLKPQVSRAQMHIKQSDSNAAAQMLRQVLKNNPQHAVANILLGEQEYFSFKHVKEGIELVRTGLEGRAPKSIQARAWVVIAVQYDREQKIKEAIEASSKAFSLDPTNLSAKELLKRLGGQDSAVTLKAADRELVALGEEYVKKGNHFAAQAEFKSAFELNPKNGRAAMLAGKSLWELNQSIDAIGWLKKAITADASLLEAYVLLADYLSQRYDFTAAGKYLRTARSIVRQSYLLESGAALIELRRLNYKGAIDLAQKSLKLYDSDVDTHTILGEALLGLGESQKAFEIMSKAISLDQNNKKAQSVYAEVLAKYQGVDAAANYLKNLISSYPQENQFRIVLGKIYLKDDRNKSAIEILSQVIQQDERSKEAHVLIGQAYQKNEETRSALKAYLTAAGLDPSDVRPVFAAGELYMATKNYQKAKEQFERVNKVNPLYPRTHYYLGKVALLTGQPDVAIQQSIIEKRQNPLLAEGYVLAGDAYMARRDFLKAASEYSRASQIQPNNATIQVYLARAHRRAENYQVAETLLARAMKLESGNPEIYKEQGAIFEAKQEFSEARIAYEKYLELSPNAEDKNIIEMRLKSLGGK